LWRLSTFAFAPYFFWHGQQVERNPMISWSNGLDTSLKWIHRLTTANSYRSPNKQKLTSMAV
jgi:hypothetical protein